MMFARKWTRIMGVALLAVMLALGCSVWAGAELDPIEFTIEVLPDTLTEPGEVSVSLKVANTGSEDMISPVTLYDPDGNVVTSFGDGGSFVLPAGAFRTWEGVWNVTQAQLDQGEVTYSVKYHLEDENGEMVAMTTEASAPVTFIGEKVDLSVTRTISPEVVRSGGTATVLYELYNNGNVDLTDIRVEEKITKKAQTVAAIKAGESVSLTFTSKIGNADLTSAATITYKAKGNSKTQSKVVEAATIPLAKPNLKIELSSPTTGVNIGDTAELLITFTNTGNVSYSNVAVSDVKRGQIASNLSIPAGSTVTEKLEFILMEKTEFKVTATLPDNTGETKTVTTEPLTINVFDPEKTLLLTLNLTCDHETVEKTPADVRFTLNVTNNSNVKAEKIAILHGSQPITTIAELEPGASTAITRDVRVSQAGKFRFTASVKDAMSNTVTFDSNTIQLSYAPAVPVATAVVRPTVAPPAFVTPVPTSPMFANIRDVLSKVALVLGALLGVGLLLFLISSVVRLAKRNKSKAAYDHLELSERRDYNEPAQGDPDFGSDSEPAVTAKKEERGETPREKPSKQPPQEAKKPVQAEAKPEEAPQTDGEGGYRVSRADAPKAQPEVKAEKTPEPIVIKQKAAEPIMVKPKAAETGASAPKAGEPIVIKPKAVEPEVIAPRGGEPVASDEDAFERRITEQRAAEHKAVNLGEAEPKKPEPEKVEPEQGGESSLGDLIKPRRRTMEIKLRNRDD